MLQLLSYLSGLGTFLCVLSLIFFLPQYVLAGRLPPGIFFVDHHLVGLAWDDLAPTLEHHYHSLTKYPYIFKLRSQHKALTLTEMGFQLDSASATEQIRHHSRTLSPSPLILTPQLKTNHLTLNQRLQSDFGSTLKLPRNADVRVNEAGDFELIPSLAGESVDTDKLASTIQAYFVPRKADPHAPTLELTITPTEALVSTQTAERAKQHAISLLAGEVVLKYKEKEWPLSAPILARMMSFEARPKPGSTHEYQLEVVLDQSQLAAYLSTTLAPEIDQTATDARFSIMEGKVEQFGLPTPGRKVNAPATATRLTETLLSGQSQVEVAVDTTEANLQDLADIQNLGLTALLGVGESQFISSPPARNHNISVGASKYHGLLIPPHTEFSFNQFLGPVTAAAGYKPALVIKHNATVPEFGGGLCQVSTTVFRAAMSAGLPITERRNHAYVVQYYGKPGFDATIYPSVTDLKFVNDTPNFILIQTRLEKTTLAVEIWGTNDGRTTEVEGPVTYERRAGGAVKAVLRRRVKDAQGNLKQEDTFYSNYRSPSLFPRTLG